MGNRLTGRQDRPDIVIVTDEYGDLVRPDFKSNGILKSIIRLAQHGKDAGIHLILSTCRLSVDIVTGLIKANFPTRIAFRTATMVDSQTVLGWRFRSKGTQKSDDYFGVKPPKRAPI